MRKNNLFKKAIAISMSVCTLMTATGVEKISVNAENVYEAYEIQNKITGTVSTENPRYYYSFTTDSTDSLYKVSLKAWDTDNCHAKISIFTDKEMTRSNRVFENIVGGSDSKEWDLGKELKPNTTYYVCVGSNQEDNDIFTTKFEASIEKYSTDDYADDKKSPNSIEIGNMVKGVLNNENDLDYFTFTTDETDSYYTMDLKASTDKDCDEYGGAWFEIYSDAELTTKVYNGGCYINKSQKFDLEKMLEPSSQYYVVFHSNNRQTIFVENNYEFNISKYSTDDHKDDKASLTRFEVGDTVKGVLNHEKDVDYFTFTTDDTDSYYSMDLKVVCENGSDEYSLAGFEIYSDAEMTNKVFEEGCYINKSEKYDLIKKLEPSKQYYIAIHSNNRHNLYMFNDYEFVISKYSTDDHKDDKTALTDFKVGETVKGVSSHEVDVDYFTFKTDAVDAFYKMKLKVSCDKENDTYSGIWFKIYSDAEMTTVVYDEGCLINNSKEYDLAKILEPSKQYYVAVFSNNRQNRFVENSYEFKITATKDDVTDDAKSAKSLKLNTAYNYKLENQVDVDQFKIKTSNYINYQLILKNATKDKQVRVEIFTDAKQTNKIEEFMVYSKGQLDAAYRTIKLSPFKTYYFKVTGDAGVKYTIGLNAATPSGKVKNASTKKVKKVTLSWKKVDKASGYEIYRATKNGAFKKVATVKSAKTVSWTDKKVKKGNTYKYKIRAYANYKGKVYYSAFSPEKVVKIS